MIKERRPGVIRKEEGTIGRAEVRGHKMIGVMFSFGVLVARFGDWIKYIRPSHTKGDTYMRIKDLNGSFHTSFHW